MATIVTVHGTYASGTPEGSAWWQRGSTFEADLRRYVESADGPLDFEPHIWDGANSETSRRLAGNLLAAKIDDLERRQISYCVLGHSHGGSVVTSALLQRVARNRPLDRLERWITIGTPFVSFSRKGLLFSRLGLLGKAAYVTFVTLLMMVGLAGILDNYAKDTGIVAFFAMAFLTLNLLVSFVLGWFADRRMIRAGVNLVSRGGPIRLMPRMGLVGRFVYLIVLLAALVAGIGVTIADNRLSMAQRLSIHAGLAATFIGFHFFMRWLGERLMARRSIRSRAAGTLADRHLAVWHEQDEAVQGLKQMPHVSFPIFGSGFAVGPLTFVAVIAIPALTALAVTSPAFMNWLAMTTNPSGFSEKIFKDGALAGGGHDIVPNIVFLWAFPSTWLFPATSAGRSALLALTLSPLLYLAGAVAMIAIVRILASFASGALAHLLDIVTWSQIKASAFGSDSQGEVARGAEPKPSFIANAPALPAALAREITAAADRAAASAITKLRASIGQLAFAEGDKPRADVISEYLTWDELIHTAYFKAPRFNKLVAYAIAHTDGFRPTAAFRADPDYGLVGDWFRQLTAPGGNVGVGIPERGDRNLNLVPAALSRSPRP